MAEDLRQAKRRIIKVESAKTLGGPVPSGDAAVRGAIDGLTPSGRISGWCWSTEEPNDRRSVVIELGGEAAATAVANVFRSELAAAGIGDGGHGFAIRLPRSLLARRPAAVVSLRDERSGEAVGEAVRVDWDLQAHEAESLAAFGRIDGELNKVTPEGELWGWAWRPTDPEQQLDIEILVDDRLAGSVVANDYRADLAAAGISDGRHGFSYILPWSLIDGRRSAYVAARERSSGSFLGSPIFVAWNRLDRTAERVVELEREVRLLRSHLQALTTARDERLDSTALRELFRTIGAFFESVGDSFVTEGGQPELATLRASIEELTGRFPTIELEVSAAPLATVVVFARGSFEATYRAIASLRRAAIDGDAEIFLVDDGRVSRASLMPAVVRNLRYVRAADAGGASEGANEIAADAQTAVICFLSGDATVDPAWLDEILATFRWYPEAAVVGSRVVRLDGTLESAGAMLAAGVEMVDPGRFEDAESRDFAFAREVDGVSLAGFAVSRIAFLAAGGFDSSLPSGTREAHDLCLAVRAAGQSVVYQPLAVATRTLVAPRSAEAMLAEREADEDAGRRMRRKWAEVVDADGRGFDGDREGRLVAAAHRVAGRALVIEDAGPGSSISEIADRLTALRRLGYEVAVAVVDPARPGEPALSSDADAALRRAGVRVLGQSSRNSVAEYLRQHGKGLSLIQVNGLANFEAHLASVRDHAPDAKVVLGLAWSSPAATDGTARKGARRTGAARRGRTLEAARKADLTILLDGKESRAIADVLPGKSLVQATVPDEEVPPAYGGRNGLSIAANFAHAAVTDAVTWFVAEVMPLVKSAIPEVKLHLVVTGGPMPRFDDAAADDLVLHDRDGDGEIASVLDGVRLGIAPPRFGGGFRASVAASLGRGVPVAATLAGGAECGLGEDDGVVVADGSAALAEAVIGLHEDEALWSRLASRARSRAVARSPLATVTATYTEALARLGLPEVRR